MVSGGWDLLKHEAKNAFKSSAFSISLSAEVEPDVNVGILLQDSMRELQTFQNSLGLDGSIFKREFFGLLE